MGPDAVQCALIIQGNLSKTALGLAGYMPSHGKLLSRETVGSPTVELSGRFLGTLMGTLYLQNRVLLVKKVPKRTPRKMGKIRKGAP